MRVLLDTHTLIWGLINSPRLSQNAKEAIETADEVHVSAASIWEISTKFRLGKLHEAGPLATDAARVLEHKQFIPLAVSIKHGRVAGNLPGPHRDPFDRMLIAQALTENLILVSNEKPFDEYGVRRLW